MSNVERKDDGLESSVGSSPTEISNLKSDTDKISRPASRCTPAKYTQAIDDGRLDGCNGAQPDVHYSDDKCSNPEHRENYQKLYFVGYLVGVYDLGYDNGYAAKTGNKKFAKQYVPHDKYDEGYNVGFKAGFKDLCSLFEE